MTNTSSTFKQSPASVAGLLWNLRSRDKLSDPKQAPHAVECFKQFARWVTFARREAGCRRSSRPGGNLPAARRRVAPLLPPGCCPSLLVSLPNAFQSCAQDTLLHAVLETRARSGRGREGARRPLRSHSRRLSALGRPAVPSSAHFPGPLSWPV